MPGLLDQLAKDGSVLLEGYGHQVGGHHLLMKFQDAICKPLLTREHFFYETVPQSIRDFIPAYHGVIAVNYVRKPSGDIQLIATPKASTEYNPVRVNGHGKYALKCSTGQSIHDGESSITSTGVANGKSYVNPWAAACTKNTKAILNQYQGDQLDSLFGDYVVLENLTAKYVSPSVLDLKVGTRQHGDDVSEAKKKKHIETCANSTSSTLGVRLGGLQRFDVAKNECTFYDKYYGRRLNDEQFYQELANFFHNGVCFRSDLLPSIIEMLHQLKSAVQDKDGYRFFSSSLLFIYDGSVIPEQCAKTCQNHYHTTDDGNNSPPVENGLKEDPSTRHPEESKTAQIVVNGGPPSIDSEGSKSSQIIANGGPPVTDSREPDGPKTSQIVVDSGCPSIDSEASNCACTPNDSHTSSTAIGKNNSAHSSLDKMRSQVDIRMIDFAHSTHPGYVNDVRHSGPDEGYMVGLDTLIGAFESMQHNEKFI